jgi:hypothetical protein
MEKLTGAEPAGVVSVSLEQAARLAAPASRRSAVKRRAVEYAFMRSGVIGARADIGCPSRSARDVRVTGECAYHVQTTPAVWTGDKMRCRHLPHCTGDHPSAVELRTLSGPGP